MTGLPLSHELVSLGAHSLGLARTAPAYRLYRLPGGPVMKPGLVRGATGAEIEVELWSVPVAGFGSFVARIPAPLGIGTIELTDGRSVKSFLCEAEAVRNAEDISRHGGWRNYLAALREREAVSPT
jgi:allophanate hydrolase